MKNSILSFISLILSCSVAIAQKQENSIFINTVENNSLYWHYNDSTCNLVLHKSDSTNEKMLVFRGSKPTDNKIQGIKFGGSLCGILFESYHGHSYFLLSQKDKIWKIVTIYGWNEYMTSANPSEVLSVNLDAVNQVTVSKRDNSTEVTAFDNDGKPTITKKKW